MPRKIEDRRRMGPTEDEIVGWNHLLSGHEFEPPLGDNEGQGNLVCCSPCGLKESDTTELLNDNGDGLVAKSCPTLCDPKDYSTPGFPVLHYLPEFAQIHVH